MRTSVNGSESIFTDGGEEWISKMVELIKGKKFDQSAELGHHESWGKINRKDGIVPKNHPQYGNLVEKSADQQYVLIRTNKNIDKIHNPGPDPRDKHPHYKNENFGKVRIYCEAKKRGVDHLFVPITGWDGSNFHWITMPVLDDYTQSDGGTCESKDLINKLLSQDKNWVIHDEEVGTYNGKKVLADYGMFWYDGSWQVSEEQIQD